MVVSLPALSKGCRKRRGRFTTLVAFRWFGHLEVVTREPWLQRNVKNHSGEWELWWDSHADASLKTIHKLRCLNQSVLLPQLTAGRFKASYGGSSTPLRRPAFESRRTSIVLVRIKVDWFLDRWWEVKLMDFSTAGEDLNLLIFRGLVRSTVYWFFEVWSGVKFIDFSWRKKRALQKIPSSQV